MKFWTMPLKSGNRLPSAKEEEDPTCPNGEPLEASRPSCSIRVTSENKALCIINPLFLSVHSDVSWLDLAPAPCRLASRREPLQESNGSAKAASREPGVRQRSQNRPRSLEGEEKALKGYVVEGALYKCILKPLRDSVYAQLQDFRSQDGTLDKLRGHQATMREQSLAEMGVVSGVPDPAGLERLQTKLSLLHQAYSPRKKETQMLKVCKMLYETMNQTPGRTEPFGADDFLPVLIYMLVNCDIVSVQLDVEYMMELMDPSQLQGEGGYYLTTWFGALFHIANFQPAAMITRQISVEAQRSIHQWHRRRTIHPHHHHPIRRHSQNILYISFHEPFNNQKTVAVTAEMTTASVCAVCAEKFGVSKGEAYGLFLVSGESSQLLAEDSHPQRVHSGLLRSKGDPASFVYKPKDWALPATGHLPLQDHKRLTDPLESRDTEPSAAD
uniref:VPS9 domain-containing protein n=1 Tax=Anolis carolinensis TaxID=28377 RepID=H9GFI7_ANOCA